MTKSLKNILNPIKTELNEVQTLINKTVLEDSLFSTFQNISLEGKKLRASLTVLTYKILNNKENNDNILKLASAIELIHLASLIHDDVIDKAEERRQSPSLNALKGNKTAVIAGDYILSKALTLLSQINNPKVIEIFANSMENLCKGEILQKEQLWRVPTKKEYIEKSQSKTANLFLAAMKSASIIANNENKSIEKYALNFGIAFQIQDDLLNIKNDLSDIKSGIFTLPAIYTIEEKPFLKDNLEDLENEITKSTILKTQQTIEIYTNKAIEALEGFKKSNYKNTLIEIANYNRERQS